MKQNILQELRISRGVSREDLAEVAGLTVDTIDAIESGIEIMVSIKAIAKIADFFKLQPSDIFTA